MKAVKDFAFNSVIFASAFYSSMRKRLSNKVSSRKRIGFLVEEFFHNDLRGFGGYGMTVKNLTDYYNTNGKHLHADVLLASMLNQGKTQVKRYHNADVLMRENHTNQYVRNYIKYCHMTNKRKLDLLISIDWYRSYEYPAMSLPNTPLLVWIHDPRAQEEWEKIATVPLEMQVIGTSNQEGDIEKITTRKSNSIHNIMALSKKLNRKILFACTTPCLVERAKRAYQLDDIDAFFLPISIKLPKFDKPQYSAKPSVCLLGRLEPVKRPWIYFELAKHFPGVDFYVAGKAHYANIMNPIIDNYRSLPNLKFLGHISGTRKHQLLKNVWAVINTSIHEALPVSFLEAFSYGKPIISCQDPDGLVSTYGYATGEILGEGLEEGAVKSFREALENCLNNKKERKEKGMHARAFVEENYTHNKFDQMIKENVLSKI